MQDNDEICEEVKALLERMDTFPDEFSSSQAGNKWYRVTQSLEASEDKSLFTVAEHRALTAKMYQIERKVLRESILKTIVHVTEDSKLTGFETHYKLTGTQKKYSQGELKL